MNGCPTLGLIKLGVPQGSILGPLLFLIYINDLPQISHLDTFLFADDTTLIASNQNLETLIEFAQNEFRKICQYFRQHGLSLNAKKTNFILFSNSNIVKNRKIEFFIDNNNLDQNDPSHRLCIEQISHSSSHPYVKFLGVLLDPDLSFKSHLNYLNSQISKGLYFLRASKNFFSQFCLTSIYYTLIHSYLTYAVTIWSSVPSSLLNPIIKKQKAAIRIICNEKYNAHTEPLFKKLRILPLLDIIYYFNLCFMQNYIQGFLPVSFINYWPTNRELRNAGPEDQMLRNDLELFHPYSRLKTTQYFPFFKLPRLWNTLNNEHPEISILRDRSEFKLKLKNFLLSKLSEDRRCDRLFCHTCSNLP